MGHTPGVGYPGLCFIPDKLLSPWRVSSGDQPDSLLPGSIYNMYNWLFTIKNFNFFLLFVLFSSRTQQLPVLDLAHTEQDNIYITAPSLTVTWSHIKQRDRVDVMSGEARSLLFGPVRVFQLIIYTRPPLSFLSFSSGSLPRIFLMSSVVGRVGCFLKALDSNFTSSTSHSNLLADAWVGRSEIWLSQLLTLVCTGGMAVVGGEP